MSEVDINNTSIVEEKKAGAALQRRATLVSRAGVLLKANAVANFGVSIQGRSPDIMQLLESGRQFLHILFMLCLRSRVK